MVLDRTRMLPVGESGLPMTTVSVSMFTPLARMVNLTSPLSIPEKEKDRE